MHGYKTLGPIAAGAFSQVQRAMHLNSRTEVAVKTFNKQKCAKAPHLGAAMRGELEALRLMQPACHPALANLLEVVDSRAALHAILQYCGGGSLHRKMQACAMRRKGVSEDEAVSLCSQVSAGLQHMHSLSIAHRDVKPENVLFVDPSQSQVKLCDFGFAKICGDQRCRTVCGSPQYMAPEVNGRAPYAGPPVDLWALGALAFELLHASPAFRGTTLEQLAIRIHKASHEAFSSSVSPLAKAYIKALLTVDVGARLTAESACNHRWLQPCAAAPPALTAAA